MQSLLTPCVTGLGIDVRSEDHHKLGKGKFKKAQHTRLQHQLFGEGMRISDEIDRVSVIRGPVKGAFRIA
jgi:hypothetical protein